MISAQSANFAAEIENLIMMKKLILLAVMAIAATAAMAQSESSESLYEKVYKDASEKVNDPNASVETIEINQFKVTVLNYIGQQVESRKLQKDSYFYDSQAVNLKCFVDEFIINVTKARAISTEKRLQVIGIYRDASLNNPLFGDTDKDRTYCYVNDTKTYTPFSLDTDWEKAYNDATAKVKAALQ